MTSNDHTLSQPADILIVDDTIANLRLLSDILTNADYRVRPAERPRLAIDSALAQPPSLILLDVKMPEMDGFEVCRFLKQDERTKDIPVIFISALRDMQARVQGFEAGGVDFISKPFQDLEVLARVKTHLHLRRMQLHLEDLVAERTTELYTSEEKYRSLITHIPDVTWTRDSKGKIIFISSNIKDIYGYSHEEIYAQADRLWFDRIHPEDVENVVHAFGALFETGARFDIEYRIQTKKGDWKWLHDRAIATYQKDGVLYADGIFSDITEHKRAEVNLRASEERFRATFEQAAVGIAHVSPDGHFIRINQKFCDILGYTHQEMQTKCFQDITHPDDLEADLELVCKLLVEDEDSYSLEKRYFRKNGEVVWVHLTVSLVRNEAGQPQWFVSVIKDISQRKLAERKIRDSEEKIRRLLEQSPISIQIHGPDGRLQQSNAAYARLYALNPETLAELYEKYNVFDDEQVREKGLMPFIKRAFRGEVVNFPPYEYDGVDTLKTLDISNPVSRSCWIRTRGFPIQDPHGEVLNVVFMSEDITESRKSEEDLRQLRDELLHTARKETMGELSSAIAHELNQPLASIMSNAQAARRFLDRDPPPLDKVKDILSDIVKNDRRAGDIIRKLRMLLKKDTSEFSAVTVNELVEDVLVFSHSNAVTGNVHVERNFDETLPPVWGDRTQLQQVFLNLILNALDSFSDTSKDNRHIVITTRHENETEVCFSIKDSGCGIDESITNDVFNPFVTTKKEGMGMGLAINKTIVQSHGGRIWAENNPDGGAIFNVVLPVKREEKT